MSDSLREEIARKIYARNADWDYVDDCPIAWDELSDGYRECWYADADAILPIIRKRIVDAASDLDALSEKYNANKLPDQARGVSHAALVMRALAAAGWEANDE